MVNNNIESNNPAEKEFTPFLNIMNARKVAELWKIESDDVGCFAVDR